jgi:hypothetical protein
LNGDSICKAIFDRAVAFTFFVFVGKMNWDLAQSLPPSCPRAIHLPRQREAKQYLLLSHSKPLRKSAILNNFVWFHDMPPSDEGGGNRKVDGGRDNAKQKFTVTNKERASHERI